MNRPRFSGELAPIVGRTGHDRVAIGPQSNRDREPRSRLSFNHCHLIPLEGMPTMFRRSWLRFRLKGTTVAPRSNHDRVAIGLRSRDSCISGRPPSDEDQRLQVSPRATEVVKDRDRLIHSRRRSNASSVSTCHQLSAPSNHLNSFF